MAKDDKRGKFQTPEYQRYYNQRRDPTADNSAGKPLTQHEANLNRAKFFAIQAKRAKERATYLNSPKGLLRAIIRGLPAAAIKVAKAPSVAAAKLARFLKSQQAKPAPDKNYLR